MSFSLSIHPLAQICTYFHLSLPSPLTSIHGNWVLFQTPKQKKKNHFSLPLQPPVLLPDPSIFLLLVVAQCFPIISMSSGAVSSARPGPTRLPYLHLRKLGLTLPKCTYGAVGGVRLIRLSLQRRNWLRIAQIEKHLSCCFQVMEELPGAVWMSHGTSYPKEMPWFAEFPQEGYLITFMMKGSMEVGPGLGQRFAHWHQGKKKKPQ